MCRLMLDVYANEFEFCPFFPFAITTLLQLGV